MKAILSRNRRLLANFTRRFYNAPMSPSEWEYLEGKRLPWPVPWHDLFGRPAPLFVEIGFGNGQFLLDLAARRSDANVVGLEISQPSLRNTQRKIAARRQENVRLVYANAEQALWTLFAARSLSVVYINFPDPWPKAGHQSRRLVNPSFLSLLGSRTHEGATLDIATDDAAYAQEASDHLRASPYFESRLPQPYAYEDETRVRTKYESIARAEGRRCHYFKWRRNGVAAHDPFPLPQELDMPHLILSNSPPLAEIAANFKPATHAGEWGVIRFIGLFQARGYPTLLVDTYVEEPALSQRLGLQIRARRDGTLVLGVHELGFPRATGGVHRAIRRLADALIEQYPLVSITSSNLVT